MGLFIGEEDVELPTEHCSFNYTAEASQLGWAPGFFPEVLETSLGNKLHFVRQSLTAEKAEYVQAGGCISLTVYND